MNSAHIFLIALLVSANIGLDHQILRTADEEQMLFVVAPDKHQVAQLIQLPEFGDSKATASFAANLSTDPAEYRNRDKNEQQDDGDRANDFYNVVCAHIRPAAATAQNQTQVMPDGVIRFVPSTRTGKLAVFMAG